MKKFIVLFKDKDLNTISMLTGLTYKEAHKQADNLRKHGMVNIQLRMLTKGMSSTVVV